MPGVPVALGTIYLPLAGLVDVTAETARLRAEIAKARGFLAGIDAKLGNAGFMAKAPPQVVEGQRAKRDELNESVARMERLIATFSAAM